MSLIRNAVQEKVFEHIQVVQMVKYDFHLKCRIGKYLAVVQIWKLNYLIAAVIKMAGNK